MKMKMPEDLFLLCLLQDVEVVATVVTISLTQHWAQHLKLLEALVVALSQDQAKWFLSQSNFEKIERNVEIIRRNFAHMEQEMAAMRQDLSDLGSYTYRTTMNPPQKNNHPQSHHKNHEK